MKKIFNNISSSLLAFVVIKFKEKIVKCEIEIEIELFL